MKDKRAEELRRGYYRELRFPEGLSEADLRKAVGSFLDSSVEESQVNSQAIARGQQTIDISLGTLFGASWDELSRVVKTKGEGVRIHLYTECGTAGKKECPRPGTKMYYCAIASQARRYCREYTPRKDNQKPEAFVLSMSQLQKSVRKLF